MTEGTVKLFSLIDIDGSDPAVCFGLIGNGSAFCLKKRCNVKTHSSSKMTFAGLKESFAFIRCNAQGSVFSEPKLSTSKLSDDVRAEWESKELSATDWAAEFQAIDGTSEVLTPSEGIQVESLETLDSLD